MKLNNRGFALTSMIYMLIVLFLLILLLVLSNLASRKIVLDKIKGDVKNKLDQGIIVDASELPYQNTTTGIYYETMQLAFSNSSDGDTIKLTRNAIDETESTLDQNKTLTLDLNSFKITRKNGRIVNNGNLTITDTTGSGMISCTNRAVTNNGSLTVLGNLEINSISDNASTIVNDGTIEINGAKISSTNYKAIYNGNTIFTAQTIIKSGTITAKNKAIENYSSPNTKASPAVKIENGTLESETSHAIYSRRGMIYVTGGSLSSTGSSTINNVGDGIIEFAGGTITCSGSYGINNSGSSGVKTGIVNITGGTITTNSGTAVNGQYEEGTITIGTLGASNNTYPAITGRVYTVGDVTIHSGTITATTTYAVLSKGNIVINDGNISSTTSAAVYATSAGKKITVNGGNITCDTKVAVGSSDDAGADIEINGGTITRTTGTDAAVQSKKGNITVTNGTIISSGRGIYTTSGIITIGIDGGTPSTTMPSISGGMHGIQKYNSGNIYFYDGIVTGGSGSNSSINGGTVVPQSGYQVNRVVSGTTETATLQAQ